MRLVDFQRKNWKVWNVSASWVGLTLLSALALGVYEVAKKVSVRDNPVAPVLY